jgi:hypothetical protein
MLRRSFFCATVTRFVSGWLIFEELRHVSIGVVGTIRKSELSVERIAAAVVRAD